LSSSQDFYKHKNGKLIWTKYFFGVNLRVLHVFKQLKVSGF
jgi:hypothetical protein